ncbi:hypothetical protein [Acidocella sp.]|jgi:hypothetical protein|uniref:hypothetical protein n=1 Tax=Acidocella sp. TaxID=50710 RepID=UPI002F41D85D
MNTATETLGALLQRYAGDNDEPRDVPRVRFDEAMQSGDDPLHILPYLTGLGIAVRRIDDLLQINDDETEEEIHAFRVAEGIAVVMASDGNWLLFEPGAAS